MAAHAWYIVRLRRAYRRIFRDRTNPMDVFNDTQIHLRFRLPRAEIYAIVAELEEDIAYVLPRKGSLPPLLQVCLTLRYYATGSYMPVVGDLIGVDRTTACRTIHRVTNAFFKHVAKWINLTTQEEANRQKIKFYNIAGFPDVIGCVDGTHVRIQAPVDCEDDYVNRKNFHSMNIQVICNADLMFLNVVARWPGAVHDARILRSSPLFAAFESANPPLDGILLGDSGYMLRTWLLTPIRNPENRPEMRYNYAHSATRCTVERAIGVAKQRWRCLRVGIVFDPERVSRIVMVCFMLANRARILNLPAPDSDEDEPAGDPELQEDNENADNVADQGVLAERARLTAGKRARDRLIANNFTNNCRH